MANILTKPVLNKISRYFLKLGRHLSKPEARCVREMVMGILKKQQVHVNKIASGIKDRVALPQTTKRFRNHYNKKGFSDKLHLGHLESVKGHIHNGDYIIFDGSDIQKKYATMMEGLDWVKDGDGDHVGPGYWLMNAVHFGSDGEMTPLLNNLYSFDHGAMSANRETIGAIDQVLSVVDKDVTLLLDRGMDTPFIRGHLAGLDKNFVLRLNARTKLLYNGKELAANQVSRKLTLSMGQTALRTGKDGKKRPVDYLCAAAKVKLPGTDKQLWLVVAQRRNGGYCWLLARSAKDNAAAVTKEAFRAYAHRWKIEEYHRHMKSQYNLESVQVKTFEGLKSILAIMAVAMAMVYRTVAPLHSRLILEGGVRTMNKGTVTELCNFVYYKIGTILQDLLSELTPRAFLPTKEPPNDRQLRFSMDWDT